MRRTRHTLLAAAAGVACLVAGAPAAASAASLSGAGSTLINPLENQWAAEFQSLTGTSVTYAAVGSGAGIAQISARTVDFGASDAPLSPTQQAGCANCVQIPWALTATAIGFNISGVTKLNLTGPVLAKIYLGHITNWNDPQIAAINKGVALPNLKITVVYRSDGSGDTYAFTDYLSRVDSEFKGSIGTSTKVSFPVGVGGKGNDGITAVLVSTDGSIGYVSAAYLIAHHLRAAGLKNAAGKFELPNLKNIEQAGQSVKKVPENNEMHIVNPPKRFKQAYPLSTFTYVIVPTDAPQKSLLRNWIEYALTKGQRFGAALDFPAIPKPVIKAARRTLAKLA